GGGAPPPPPPGAPPPPGGGGGPPHDLISLFSTPLLAQAGLVEARVVRKALRAAAAGEPLPLDGLADLVSLELWLRRLLSRRGTCWTGTPARARAVPAGVTPMRGALASGA
ncbi:asparagine synthase, partial [Streptomyces sp. NPDC059627]